MKPQEPAEVVLDEARFLRQVRWRSTMRNILIAALVVGVALIGTFIGTRYLLNYQEDRIASFYAELVRYSEPNTTAIAGAGYDVGWFSRQKEYHLFRTVGRKPVAVGTVSVNFQIWGGEQFWDPGRHIVRANDGRNYLPPAMVPALQFYNPMLTGLNLPAETAALVQPQKLPREFDRLASLPKDYQVEIALSFNRPLSREEVTALLPAGVDPLWGAIEVYSKEEIARQPYLANRLVGKPLGTSLEGEAELTDAQFITRLEDLARVPGYSAKNLARTAAYLKANGVKYYGVVVAGRPDDLARLAANPAIAAAVTGIVVTAPW